MKQLSIRYQRLSDARRFFAIRSHPDFIPFSNKPKTLKRELAYLRKTAEKRRKNLAHNFTILWKGRVVGAVGLRVDQHRKHIGEIGYFVAREQWGKGIATAAVRLLEKVALRKLGIVRLEILTLRDNAASQRVARKCGYVREGVQRGKQLHHGKYRDVNVFAKIRGTARR